MRSSQWRSFFTKEAGLWNKEKYETSNNELTPVYEGGWKNEKN